MRYLHLVSSMRHKHTRLVREVLPPWAKMRLYDHAFLVTLGWSFLTDARHNSYDWTLTPWGMLRYTRTRDKRGETTAAASKKERPAISHLISASAQSRSPPLTDMICSRRRGKKKSDVWCHCRKVAKWNQSCIFLPLWRRPANGSVGANAATSQRIIWNCKKARDIFFSRHHCSSSCGKNVTFCLDSKVVRTHYFAKHVPPPPTPSKNVK